MAQACIGGLAYRRLIFQGMVSQYNHKSILDSPLLFPALLFAQSRTSLGLGCT